MSGMVRIRIDADERYPDYSVRANDGCEVDATSEQVDRWKRVLAAYEQVQDEMGQLYEAARAVKRDRFVREEAEREAAEKVERDRLARERQEAAVAREAALTAMREQIAASGDVVFDAQGRPIGRVNEAGGIPTIGGGSGLSVRIEP